MSSILFVLWFFLPAGIANAAPVFATRAVSLFNVRIPLLHHLNTPIDAGRSWRGKRIFGENKTWRGLLFGILSAIIVVYIQQLLWQHQVVTIFSDELMQYMTYSPVLLGFLFGFGALAGDFIESFAKRQAGVPSGKSWFPFDQTDYVIGGCVAIAAVANLPIVYYLLTLVIWFGMHLLFSYIGYLLKLKPQPI